MNAFTFRWAVLLLLVSVAFFGLSFLTVFFLTAAVCGELRDLRVLTRIFYLLLYDVSN